MVTLGGNDRKVHVSYTHPFLAWSKGHFRTVVLTLSGKVWSAVSACKEGGRQQCDSQDCITMEGSRGFTGSTPACSSLPVLWGGSSFCWAPKAVQRVKAATAPNSSLWSWKWKWVVTATFNFPAMWGRGSQEAGCQAPHMPWEAAAGRETTTPLKSRTISLIATLSSPLSAPLRGRANGFSGWGNMTPQFENHFFIS